MQAESLQETVEVLQSKHVELTRALDEWVAAIKLLAMRSGEVLLGGVPLDRLLDDESSANDTASETGSDRSGRSADWAGSASSLELDLGGAEMARMDMDLEPIRKDRSECTQQELERIRRERNRMHAKRTRVRKKAQMEELQETINEVSLQNPCLVIPCASCSLVHRLIRNTLQLEQSNLQIGERIAWLCSQSFSVQFEEAVPVEKSHQ